MLLWSHLNSCTINMDYSVLGKSMLLVLAGVMQVLLAAGQSNPTAVSQISSLTEVESCISGTWKIEEKMYGGTGWGECKDEKKDALIQFDRDSIVYDGMEAEGIIYYCDFVAIKDSKERFHGGDSFERLGYEGDYFLTLCIHYDSEEQEKVCPFDYFVLFSDREIVIPDGRALYKAVKMDNGTGDTEDIILKEMKPNSICFGLWEVTGAVNGRGHTGERIKTGKEEGSFISGRAVSSADSSISEFARILEKEGDEFIVFFEFSGDYDWDFMIVKDGMTAVVMKGENMYWAERKSDPEEDCIYIEF